MYLSLPINNAEYVTDFSIFICAWQFPAPIILIKGREVEGAVTNVADGFGRVKETLKHKNRWHLLRSLLYFVTIL
jgi:hypothetical protein